MQGFEGSGLLSPFSGAKGSQDLVPLTCFASNVRGMCLECQALIDVYTQELRCHFMLDCAPIDGEVWDSVTVFLFVVFGV